MKNKTYKGWVSKEAYLEYLLKERKALVEMGEGMSVLGINEVIARMARMLKLDYYSLD